VKGSDYIDEFFRMTLGGAKLASCRSAHRRQALSILSYVPHQGDPQPRGRYLASEVGQLAGVSGNRIGQWARRGYIQSSWSTDSPRIYSFQDVAEAFVVHELEELKVTPRRIGDAVSTLREMLGTDWPLQSSTLFVPGDHLKSSGRGKTVALVMDQGRIEDIIRQHPVLGQVDLVEVREQLSRGGWAARDLPDLTHIEVNPDRLSGRPTIRGRRVSAAEMALLAEDNQFEILKQGFMLSDDEVSDALRWWIKVKEYERAR
jgi:uncharacterized protein (DUF433 family)